MTEEFIICSAIKIEETGKIYYGHRHNHCRDAANDELSWTLNRQEIHKLKDTQGFVTSQGRFVDREEAMVIARSMNQIKDESQIRGKKLYSEDLY